MRRQREPFYVLPSWSTLRVTGPDRSSWLDGIVSGNVSGVGASVGVWSSLLNKQGKICADLQIVAGEGELLVAVSGGNTGETLETLDSLLIMEDAEIERCDKLWIFASDSSILEELSADTGRVPLVQGPACIRWGGVEIYAVTVSVAESQEFVSRISAHALSAEEWSDWLVDNGIPRWGVDYDSSDNPHAASLDHRTVDWSKGCYLGQEVVCMQDMRGKVRRRLVRLQLSGTAKVKKGDELVNEEAVAVGRVTSVGTTCAIASVRAPDCSVGTVLLAGETKAVVRDIC